MQLEKESTQGLHFLLDLDNGAFRNQGIGICLKIIPDMLIVN